MNVSPSSGSLRDGDLGKQQSKATKQSNKAKHDWKKQVAQCKIPVLADLERRLAETEHHMRPVFCMLDMVSAAW